MMAWPKGVRKTLTAYLPTSWQVGVGRAQDWFLQLWYAHHNARVLVDMEHRFACVLCHATGGRMSKTGYDWETMQAEMNDFQQREYEEAYEEGRKDTNQDWKPAVDFAVDVAGIEAEYFLRSWREGDYDTLAREWPEWAIQVADPEDVHA